MICLNETLCDSTVSDSEIVIDEFYIIRNDRSRHGGGVYVSNKFIFKRRHDLESDVLENVWVELQYPHKSPILIGSFYRPPNSKNYFFLEFEKVL